MRVLVVQNFDNTDLGQVGRALREAEAEIDLRCAHLGEELPPDPSGHDAMVMLGGGQNALADDEYPYFPTLLSLVRDFEAADKAVLGICLGSQLLARAFGGQNRVGVATEFGWQAISLTEQAKGDPVLGALPQRFPIFQWHDDTFSLPQQAVRLASSAVAENQAFRVGRAAYGFQFHFEADQPLVREWSLSFASMIGARHPDWGDRLEGEAARHGEQADAAGLAIARAWVAAI
ncbi:MAG TPA: type 1 glutamine amidotransferase [Mesorhizobium sp.]|nr:type 1 glutamine amidotransferase [Mesorhizobium sp.]